jgi:AcrR family transcriptional regulator
MTRKPSVAPQPRGTAGASPANGVRQEEVLAAAAELFAEHGYISTTVRDIADAAGILSGSLYHHFDSKESMLDAILRDFIERTLASYAAVLERGRGPRETFEALLRDSLESMVDHRAAILIYQNEARFLLGQERFAYLGDAHLKFERIWTGVLRDGVVSGEFRAGLDPVLVYRLVRDTIWTAPRWYRPGGPLRPEQIIEQYLAMLVDGAAWR